MKKGQELSMNVIIIAAIALLVLVILSMLLFNSARTVDDNTGCTGIGGTCLDGAGFLGNPCEDEFGERWQVSNAHKCTEGQVCCIEI